MAYTGTIMTPRTDSKIRSTLLARRFKKKLPDFKDILRERFKTRIKQNRQTFFDQMRSSNETDQFFQDTLCDYLYDEMMEFDQCSASHCKSTLSDDEAGNSYDIEKELEVMKRVEDELVQEQLNWILEEYRKAEEEAQIREQTPKLVCCPVCQGGFLRVAIEGILITCVQCPIQLYTNFSLEQIEAILNQAVNEHATHCYSNPQFAVLNEPNSSGLFVICGRCSLFNALS